jgi:hypothetical protein
MQQSKKRVLAGAVIYALLASLSNAGAADAGVCSVVAKPANFDHQTVTLQGTVTALKETTSHRDNDYTTFKLEDSGGCGAVNMGSPCAEEWRSGPGGRRVRD